jgi:hypothetical protein
MAKKEKLPKTNASEIESLIERFKGSQLKPGDAELIERLYFESRADHPLLGRLMGRRRVVTPAPPFELGEDQDQ